MWIIQLQTRFGVRFYADQKRTWDAAWYEADRTADTVKRYVRRASAERVIADYGSAWWDFAPTIVKL